ncbi:MAG: hypothetical protein IRY85_03680 [Micromonosporaceae bacterium]|nr:hypothetical protein [Micromonosporaceae bacterium]
MSDLETRNAFAGLRSAVRDSVTPPPGASLRARAERQLRRRRLVTAGLVAAAVVAVLLGATTALRPTAAPPPPGQTPSPSSTTPTVPPRPPWPEPRPNLPVPERSPTTIDDPIAAVDWANVTLTVPPRANCPSGTLRFTDGRTEGFPQAMLILEDDVSGRQVVYGDVTGDGSVEAIIEVGCLPVPETAHVLTALLVITRDRDGTLRPVGDWVGPVEWQVHRDIWVQDGRILTEQQWSMPGYEWAPGAAAAYVWDGDSFESVPSGLTPVVAVGDETLGPPIDLGPDDGYIARALGCPGGTIQFVRNEDEGVHRVSRDGLLYELAFTTPTLYLADLDDDGHHYVLIQLHCREAGVPAEQWRQDGVGLRGQGILVLERTETSFVAVDLVTEPDRIVSGWWFDAPGVLGAWTSGPDAQVSEPMTWTWNGQYFQR